MLPIQPTASVKNTTQPTRLHSR